MGSRGEEGPGCWLLYTLPVGTYSPGELVATSHIRVVFLTCVF